MFVHAVKNSVQPENYHFPRGHIYQGYHFRFFDAPGLVPPPSPWTDASGLSVDASGLVPPHQVWKGGGTGGTVFELLQNV